jgi:hypothetical protein
MNVGLLQSLTKQLDARGSGISRIAVCVGILVVTPRACPKDLHHNQPEVEECRHDEAPSRVGTIKRVASSSDAARWEQQRLLFDGWASRIEFFSCTSHSWRRVAAPDPNRRLQKPEASETTRRKSRNQSRKSKVATLCY